MKSLSFFICLSLFSLGLSGQTIDEVLSKSYGLIQKSTIQFDGRFSIAFFTGGEMRANYKSVYKNINEVKFNSFISSKSDTPANDYFDGYLGVYDGKDLLENHSKNKISNRWLKEYKYVENSHSHWYSLAYFPLITNRLKDLKNNPQGYDFIRLKNSTLNRNQEIVIEFKPKSDKIEEYSYHTIKFRKKDLMPIAYHRKSFLGEMAENLTIELSNILLNPPKVDKFFNIEAHIPPDYKYLEIDKEANIETAFESSPLLNQASPLWKAPDINDNLIDLQELIGKKVIIIDFWYAECYPCIKSLPILEKLSKQYTDLLILGLNPIDSQASISNFLKKNNITYTNIKAEESLKAKYFVRNYPTLFIIDKKGIIVEVKQGYSANFENDLKAIINSLLLP